MNHQVSTQLQPPVIPKPAWNKASDKNIASYKNKLVALRSLVDKPDELVTFRDVPCQNPYHLPALNVDVLKICECVNKRVENNIPYKK